MTTRGRGQVWTGAQLAARLAELRGLAPAVAQHVVHRATTDPAAPARSGYLVPGEARRLTPSAFDFWLARRGLAGVERLAVSVLAINERLTANGDIEACELDYRRGAVDGPHHGSPARITFTGPARLARFYQAVPDGALIEIAPNPDAAPAAVPSGFGTSGFGPPGFGASGHGATATVAPLAEPEIDALAAMHAAVRSTCGEGARILDTRQPTVLETMVGIASVLHVALLDAREVQCGIVWHGPLAVALQADFPRFDVAPVLSAQQSAALQALLDAEGLVACETRQDEHGLAVVTRRRASGELLLARFDGTAVALSHYLPGRPDDVTRDQALWLQYIETFEGLGVLDAYHDAASNGLVVLTADADGTILRHHVDSEGIEAWRGPETGSAVGMLHQERIRGGVAPVATPMGPTPSPAAGPEPSPDRASDAVVDAPSAVSPTIASPGDALSPPALSPPALSPRAPPSPPTPSPPIPSGPTPPTVASPSDSPPVLGQPPFGAAVEANFPASAYDIDEATRCLLLRRPTAAVFHCQRILEQGLHAHGLWRGVVEPPSPTGQRWRSMIADLKHDEADADLIAALDAVRRGWRGARLEVGAKYTEEEAERIVALVAAFMRRLAELCDEAGDPTGEPDDAAP